MKILKLITAIFLLCGPLGTFAQNTTPSDTLLDHLTGKWLLKGTIAGAKIEHDVTVSWVLGHQYIQLKETSRERQPDGTPSYDAIVLITFHNEKGQYDCLWLDNTSNSGLSNGILAHAQAEPNKIALLFKLTNGGYFHTTFTYYAANNTWHWLLQDDENGKTDIFADAIMAEAN